LEEDEVGRELLELATISMEVGEDYQKLKFPLVWVSLLMRVSAMVVLVPLSQGYDRNRIIRPETGTEPEFRFRLTGTGMTLKNSGSG
jgi:hypothetical protein